ncbi:MAG: hypothetical protein IPI45_10245 [Saprospiraceae bacterium]|nr:hypothetical protein [Saprospiraceae bacterium]
MGQKLVMEQKVDANTVYLDHLNQIYLLDKKEHSICKYDISWNLLSKTSFKQGWDQALLDVSDPFKILMFYPGDYKIRMLDAQLNEIGSYEEPDLNEQAAVCYYSTDQIAIYSNKILKLKNYLDGSEVQSALIIQSINNDNIKLPKLIQNNGFIYLFQPGVGITRFTQQLFEDKTWKYNSMGAVSVVGNYIYVIEGTRLLQIETLSMKESLIYSFGENAISFAVNSKYAVILDGINLKVFEL